MIGTVVNILGAIFTRESGHAIAGVMGEVVDALSAVFAGRELVGAERNFSLAEIAGKAAAADAGVLADAVDTGRVVLK